MIAAADFYAAALQTIAGNARITLAAGERIRTELSHKYTPQTLEQLLAPAGFLVEELLTTAAPNTYSLVLARACE